MQQQPRGLCDAIFQALPFIAPHEHALIGLPDTVWFPENGFTALDDADLSFLCFPVDHPEFFDAVVFDGGGNVEEIQVKTPAARSHWVWGAIKARGAALEALRAAWLERDGTEHYIGTVVNRWLAAGGRARAVCAGESYVDVGTLNGYREAITLLANRAALPDRDAACG